MPTATYTGRADRYWIRDRDGRRVYLPRGRPVEIDEDVAAQLRGRTNITVTPARPARGGNENGGQDGA